VYRIFRDAFQAQNPNEESGMMFLLFNNAQWEVFSAIPIAEQQPGGPIFRPIPHFPFPVAPVHNAGAVAVDIYREARTNAGIFHAYRHALKQALITSIGTRNANGLVDPDTDTIDMSCAEIFAAMDEMYNTITPAGIAQLQRSLSDPLTSQDPDVFHDFCTTYNLTIARLTRAQQPPATSTQFTIFVEACSTQLAVATAIALFVQLHPTIAEQRLLPLQLYVTTQLRSLTIAGVGYANAANAVANASTAIVDPTVAALIQALKDQVQMLTTAIQGGATRSVRSAHVPPAASATPRVPGYCYHHGTGFHTGLHCTTMQTGLVTIKGGATIQKVFTNAMKKAKHPTDVPTGVPPGRA
jgi:hypothetical protein